MVFGKGMFWWIEMYGFFYQLMKKIDLIDCKREEKSEKKNLPLNNVIYKWNWNSLNHISSIPNICNKYIK